MPISGASVKKARDRSTKNIKVLLVILLVFEQCYAKRAQATESSIDKRAHITYIATYAGSRQQTCENTLWRKKMKRWFLLIVALGLLISGAAQAANIVDAIKIERGSAPNTFTVSFLYNSSLGDDDYFFQWDAFDLLIADEEIGYYEPTNPRAFVPGQILVPDPENITTSGDGIGYTGLYGDLYLGPYDFSAPPTAPVFQAVQISAWSDPYAEGEFPVNTPLFSFTYTGSATEFVIYDSLIDQNVVAGRIAVPAAVPEPASILGLGLPVLMIGLSKMRGLRK